MFMGVSPTDYLNFSEIKNKTSYIVLSPTLTFPKFATPSVPTSKAF